MREVEGVEIGRVCDRTFLLHLGGKLSVESKVPIRSRDDLSMIYTPGVARVCLAIAENPEDARRLTIKRNTVAVVTDGTAVLGLGDIGPLAALPVMEGKAALFKRFADIDAFPICLDTTDTEEIIRIVKAISPVFAGINLEDISAPRCFEIEARLREELDIPVFHDDQHGTAIVALAALRNALRVVGKRLEDVRLVMSGAGRRGHRHPQAVPHGRGHARRRRRRRRRRAPRPGRRASGEHPNHAWIAEHTNPDGVTGSLSDAHARGRRLPRRLGPEHPHRGRRRVDGAGHRRLRAWPTRCPRSTRRRRPARRRRRDRAVDFANQINNVLVFPGVFRGLIDSGVSHVDIDVLLAAADALADVVLDDERNATYIIPSVFHPDVSTRRRRGGARRPWHAREPA